ncbi:universal stress protein [Methylocystis heyeri]|uniref:Universal stress protein n=1 Tax=Methylocystis heyeri TaxID=391905 RepID=A0A6B8KJ62_9HYPH|nr:universal stress protein [Methylocystis heyeri]QGM47091.1 universal stress protein [Methylocystis heyeri]
MFAKILNANDGSETAFRSFSLAMSLAKRDGAELHMVCVEEIPYMPEFVQEVEVLDDKTARRIDKLLQQAQAMAEAEQVKLVTHVLKGHPVRDIVRLGEELKADLIVIGAVGHSALYERLIGSRADRIVQLAKCPVLVVK